MTALKLRRLVPRFSLRTLVVFLLLATSGVGLFINLVQEPWVLSERRRMAHGPMPGEVVEGPTTKDPPFKPLVHRGLSVQEGVIYGGGFSPDWRRFAAAMDNAVRIYDSRTGGCLYTIDVPAPDAYEAGFASDGNVIWVWAHDGVSAWRRIRPEPWWGVFYLWEFWLTVAFAGLFIWSVWRDRRALAARVPSPLVGEGQDGG